MIRIAEFELQTLDAVSCLMKAKHYVQALVVLYSAIDTLAWSTRTSGDVTRTDFCRWVAQYMEPELRLGCTAKELYSARCGLVHSGVAESRMSREGSAAEIWYATASKSVPVLQAEVARRGVTAKVVYTTDLVAAFADGAMKFGEDLESNEARQKEVVDRIRRWLTFRRLP
ncbi:hypothetical protein KAV67_00815 [Candidatus Bipolaricaulota bacterium]|nr:hypothetical protein [Candidatus Bipolaricaulota bacterium]